MYFPLSLCFVACTSIVTELNQCYSDIFSLTENGDTRHFYLTHLPWPEQLLRLHARFAVNGGEWLLNGLHLCAAFLP